MDQIGIGPARGASWCAQGRQQATWLARAALWRSPAGSAAARGADSKWERQARGGEGVSARGSRGGSERGNERQRVASRVPSRARHSTGGRYQQNGAGCPRTALRSARPHCAASGHRPSHGDSGQSGRCIATRPLCTRRPDCSSEARLSAGWSRQHQPTVHSRYPSPDRAAAPASLSSEPARGGLLSAWPKSRWRGGRAKSDGPDW